MDDFNLKVCRLCLNIIENDNFVMINEGMKNVFNTLLLKLNLEEDTKNFVCTACSAKLHAAFDFKTTCLSNESKISTCTSSKEAVKIDLWKVCLGQERSEQSLDELKRSEICRLCMILSFGEFTALQNLDMDVMHRYIPELNFKAVKDPVICKRCLDSLTIHSNFIRNCSDVDEKTKNFFNVNDSDKEKPSSDWRIKDIKSEKDPQLEEGSTDMNIKSGKCEQTEEQLIKSDGYIKTNEVAIKSEEDEQMEEETGVELPPYLEVPNVTCQADQCESDAEAEEDTLDKIQLYGCNLCDYKTKHKGNLNQHRVVHKSPLEMPWYGCVLCDYKTIRKGSLKRHMAMHKHPSEIQWHECNSCNFKTKSNGNLKKHMLVHKSPSEIEWFECDFCDYKTKYKKSLNQHGLLHKDPSELRWYKCGFCNYKSRLKVCLNEHSLIHKSPSEIKWYECDLCDYKTKYKQHLKSHVLVHKPSSEIEWYRCNSCDYTTKRKASLKLHMLLHKLPSELEMFECDSCGYKSKRKSDMKSHMLSHKAPSEIQWHGCSLCDYKTKYKHHLKSHTLVHKSLNRKAVGKALVR